MGLTVESNSSTDLTKTLKIIYSQQKGSRLYYEMLTQGKDKPKRLSAVKNGKQDWIQTLTGAETLRKCKTSKK